MPAGNKLPVLDRISDQMRAVLDKSAELAPDAYATDAGLEQMRAAYGVERRFWKEVKDRKQILDPFNGTIGGI